MISYGQSTAVHEYHAWPEKYPGVAGRLSFRATGMTPAKEHITEYLMSHA